MTITHPGFAADPFASHSAQFPLGAPFDRVSDDVPSRQRPWGLQAMQPVRSSATAPELPEYRFDRDMQMSVTADGTPLIVAGDPTAHKQTNNDGDEGPSEDWKNDFCPDDPFEV